MSNPQNTYFIPEPSKWPVLFSLALFLAFCGTAFMFNQYLATGSMPGFGSHLLLLGFVAVFYMFFVWFRDVIDES
ncbi:MAG: cytochrome c oxidase subunit 3, partial [Gammaproteobacteria bacterium]|nr:cytochrome c oxidase subunit 3 [Gammaproteobacteria bacterium]